MKLNGKMMVVVAMMVGSLGAAGCSKATEGTDQVAPEESMATAPVVDESKPGVEQDARRFHYYGPYAPPAARWEERGRAPSERHAWAPGYYRWSGREYNWNPGRWYERRERSEYIAPHWENRFGRWEYIPGYWARR